MPQYVGYQLTENLNGSITLQYTPTTPGVHKISIDCNGSSVEGEFHIKHIPTSKHTDNMNVLLDHNVI